MDRPQPVTSELERDLANIRSLNRWFGSYRQIRRFFSRWLQPNSEARILDLATGSGDIPRLIVALARRRKVSVHIDAIDQHSSTVEIARRLSSNYPEITLFCANLFEWDPGAKPELDCLKQSSSSGTYDIVLCSLALHHFSDEDAVRVLQKCRELSRRPVLVADLRRSIWLSVGVSLLTALLYRKAMTKTDARLSVARAFSFAEMRRLAERAGWTNFGHRKFPIGRQAIWLDSV